MRIEKPLPDTESEESFELLELLGRGGFAHTYRARVIDPELIEEYGTNEIALKVPLAGKQRALRKDFEMNAVLHVRLKPLRSLNLVRYLGVEIFRGQLVMAMEYISGGSLRKKLGSIDSQKRVAAAEAADIAEGILCGVAVIHQEHIFHRDIKPENILMDGRTPKVADMGIARMLESNELASSTTGTLYYMSPEILGEVGADFRSDLWSVGVTLYEMVTGKLPFGNKNTPMGTMADLIRRADPVPPNEILQEIPKTLNEIIMKALRKDPSGRFATADEMRDELERFRTSPDDLVEKEISQIRGAVGLSSMELERRLADLAKRYPGCPMVYQELGEFYNGSQRFLDAVPTFKKGIECHPTNARLHLDLALAYKGAGRNDEFVQSLQKAVELDPSFGRYAKVLLSAAGGS
jgi:serine/threonine protein kinase